MELSTLTAISPLDGRYAQQTALLRPLCSEYGLIYHRLHVEIHWLILLSQESSIKQLKAFSKAANKKLLDLLENFDLQQAQRIKAIENTTHHDVKAIEYYLQEIFAADDELKNASAYIHFALTSEDVNNLAYALILHKAREQALVPNLQTMVTKLQALAKQHAATAMLARTHGQAATPTTLGKEMANFAYRLQRQLSALQQVPIMGKLNGAVGNFNAHYVAYPEVNWPSLSEKFISQLGLTYNPYTTQIEPHDELAAFLQALSRCHNILIDFSRDMWGYISLGYFTQALKTDEVGSSTMPHKINPINFENAEGNFGLANTLAQHLANKLPISRWQRDLSDSTVLRNLGTIFGYALIGYQNCQLGLDKLTVNEKRLAEELQQHWELLSEAIQTVMRRYGISEGYEQLKQLTRGAAVDQVALAKFIDQSALPDNEKERLKSLNISDYLGQATELAEKIAKN